MVQQNGNVNGAYQSLLDSMRSHLKTEKNQKMRAMLKMLIEEMKPRHVHTIGWIIARHPMAPSAEMMCEVVENYEVMRRSTQLSGLEKQVIVTPTVCIVGPQRMLDYFRSVEYRTYATQDFAN
jgi:hypothetical protein